MAIKKNKEIQEWDRTEELQSIVERMPTNFTFVISLFIGVILTSTILLGWFIHYPVIITGNIIINAGKSPIKIVTNSSGKLIINKVKSQDFVKEGDHLASVENSANIEDIQIVVNLIKSIGNNYESLTIRNYPKNLSLGDLNASYFAFLEAFSQFDNYHFTKPNNEQEYSFKKMLHEEMEMLKTAETRSITAKDNLIISHKIYRRDSLLFQKKVLSESEYDNSIVRYNSAKDLLQNNFAEINNAKEKIQEMEHNILQNSLRRFEKNSDVKLNLLNALNNLRVRLREYEDKFIIKSPIDGQVQFSKFWHNKQFVQVGESIFTIVPGISKEYGEMILPAYGSGKVKIGQPVVIKLENYPYQEYGSIKGIVNSISLTTSPSQTDKGVVESYLVKVDLPKGLTTNYGSKLKFRFQIKGTADIVTKDRRLIERFFDNLKYSFSSK